MASSLHASILMDQTIYVAEASCDMPLDALDLRQIRRIYNQLADECLRASNAARLDLDDVILDHRAVFSAGGGSIEAAIEWVGDAQSWKLAATWAASRIRSECSGLRPRRPEAGEKPDAASETRTTDDSISRLAAVARCVALRIRVIRQADDPLTGFASG